MALQLNRREKYGIYLALVAIGLFAVIQWGLFPYLDARERRTRMVTAKADILRQMQALTREYASVKNEAQRSQALLARRSKNFTLFSFLDTLSGRVGIKTNIEYMKPATSVQKNSDYKISTVEMKFQGITLTQLTQYLHMVETSNNRVFIRRAALSRSSKTEGLLDATLMVETLI